MNKKIQRLGTKGSHFIVLPLSWMELRGLTWKSEVTLTQNSDYDLVIKPSTKETAQEETPEETKNEHDNEQHEHSTETQRPHNIPQ